MSDVTIITTPEGKKMIRYVIQVPIPTGHDKIPDSPAGRRFQKRLEELAKLFLKEVSGETSSAVEKDNRPDLPTVDQLRKEIRPILEEGYLSRRRLSSHELTVQAARDFQDRICGIKRDR